MKKEVLITLSALVMVSLLGALAFVAQEGRERNEYRPEYCDEQGCISKEVFQELPEYPEDFWEKWTMVKGGRKIDFEALEEKYWKQPEFYDRTFVEQGVWYYTRFRPEKVVRYASSGSAPYPGEKVVLNISKGEVFKATTFWHASWGVAKYQAITIEPEYPEEMKIKMGDYSVVQDPETARKCFEITTEPSYILMEPTFPYFHYGWVKRVSLIIETSEDCPIGDYGIEMVPGSPDKGTIMELEEKYGIVWLSSWRVGGTWKLFLRVEH